MAEPELKPDVTPEPEPKPEPTPAPAPEPTPDPDPADPPTEKTFSELGLDERYNDMDRPQLAEDIKHRNRVHGHQAKEVGMLRKDLAAATAKLDGFAKAAGVQPEVKEAVADMSDAELTRWLEDLQSNPRKAFSQILGDNMGRRSDEDLEKMFTKIIDEAFGQYQGYTEDKAVQSDTDYQIHANYMEGLRQPEHFGNTRSAQELLAFAKFADSGTDKPTVDALYDTMKRFPEVPMKECQNMVAGRTGGRARVDPDTIREQVKGLAGGTAPGGATKKSSAEVIENMEDAFGDGADA